MLVLSRKPKEVVRIGDILITIVHVSGRTVHVGIVAPKDIPIVRGELDLPPDETPTPEDMP